jgi:hypothetical protein
MIPASKNSGSGAGTPKPLAISPSPRNGRSSGYCTNPSPPGQAPLGQVLSPCIFSCPAARYRHASRRSGPTQEPPGRLRRGVVCVGGRALPCFAAASICPGTRGCRVAPARWRSLTAMPSLPWFADRPACTLCVRDGSDCPRCLGTGNEPSTRAPLADPEPADAA